MKNEICNRCPHEDTEKCETCEKRVCRVCGCTWNNACPGGCYWVEFDLCSECVDKDPTPAKLTYTFHLPEGIYEISGLHYSLDGFVSGILGMDVVRSELESDDEISEHDYEEDANGEDE